MNVDFYGKSYSYQVYLWKNQWKGGKHLTVTSSFSLARSVLLSIVWQILALQSWVLLLCIHSHSMKLNLTHGLLHRKVVLLFDHIMSVWLGRFLCRLFLHLFFNGKNDCKIYNACCRSKARKVFGWLMHTHSNCDNIS